MDGEIPRRDFLRSAAAGGLAVAAGGLAVGGSGPEVIDYGAWKGYKDPRAKAHG